MLSGNGVYQINRKSERIDLLIDYWLPGRYFPLLYIDENSLIHVISFFKMETLEEFSGITFAEIKDVGPKEKSHWETEHSLA
jgi:hypothetical protein